MIFYKITLWSVKIQVDIYRLNKLKRVHFALVFCVAVIKEKAIRTHEERECAK